MRILKYAGKLVEEIGHITNDKVVILKYVRREDMDKCPCCGEPIDKEIVIVEDCLNWKESIEGVESL